MARKKKVAAEEREVTITRSFARKLNMSVHGGEKFETADLACEVSCVTTEGDAEETSAFLDNFCRDEVQRTIDSIDKVAIDESEDEEEEGFDVEEDEDEEEEAPKKKKVAKKKKIIKKKKKVIDVGVKVEQDELEEISPLINDLTMAKTPKELKAAAISIKDAADELSLDQKKYLSAYYKKRKAAIEE